MHEICGDISSTHVLSRREKIAYLFYNGIRGLLEWSLPGSVRGWEGTITGQGQESSGRLYVDTYLRMELPRLVLPGKIRVLDVGCGTGYVQTLLADLGYTGEYVGLDVTREPGFAAHTEAFTVSFVESPIEAYHTEEKFDLVLSNTTFEHIRDDRAAAVTAARLLVPDGVGVHIVPSYWSLFLYLFHGYRQYTPSMLRRTFSGQRHILTGLGGLGSFLVHFCCITLPERVFGVRSIRGASWYPRLVSFAGKVDHALPVCRALTAVVTRPPEETRTRVLFALPSLLVGGIEQQLTEQLRRYDRTRFALALVTLFEYEGRESFKHKLPEDVRFVPVSMRGGLDIQGWFRLVAFLKEWKPDIVVSSMFSANTALRVLSPFFRYASIAREHNLYDEKRGWQRLLDRVLAACSCRIVAVSRDVAAFASRQAGIRKEKLVVIQNGVDVKRLSAWHASHPDREVLKQELGFTPHDRLIFTVGRLKKVKNHKALIAGFGAFARAHPTYRLVIVGSGAERESLQEEIATCPPGSVHLLERYGEAVWPYYAAADWFILPSLREGFPNVMLEAMAFGLPLLGTDISGSNECLEDGVNGFFIPTTASGLTGALNRAANVSETTRSSMGKASREKVEAFSIEETVRKYEACFDTCYRAR